ncbi:MAG: hypothetical protein AAGE18_18140 [Pseudomonadota bacterium]
MRMLAAAALVGLLAGPAGADEVTETIEAALEAYNAGDIPAAKEELDYAAQLLSQMKAEGLTGYLPEAMDGWTRALSEGQSMGAAMFGGGIMAEATYSGAGEELTMQLVADSPMVASMAAMFASTATMSAMGRVKRINRVNFVMTDGEVRGMVGAVLVQLTGNASEDAMIAHIERLDFEALEDF